MNRVTIHIDTDDNNVLNDIIRLALGLQGLAGPLASVTYEVSPSPEPETEPLPLDDDPF